jgi:hypothetical protein
LTAGLLPGTLTMVYSFSQDNLYDSLSGNASRTTVENHQQAQYLVGYLNDIGAKKFVVEDEYVDGDYLADYQSYYATCFQPISRYCKRLHFFSSDFSETDFSDLVLRKVSSEKFKEFAESYLGFVVVRPLPDAVIGRTALCPYKDDPRRRFTALVRYDVHLFGLELSVESLAFQEQDSVLAACATVALWSAFQRTAEMFGTASPRPPIITETAERVTRAQRPIPSTGLTAEQICGAIRANGLTFDVFDGVRSSFPLLSLLYGYLAAGIPVVLGVDIQNLGGHAITLTGFSLRDTAVSSNEYFPIGTPRLPMRGRRIDKVYAHDDGFGPFSRLQFVPGQAASVASSASAASTVATQQIPAHFLGSWRDNSGLQQRLTPLVAIVPIYNKIRLSFLDIVPWAIRFHPLAQGSLPPGSDLEWDIALTTTAAYKSNVHAMNLSDLRKTSLLTVNQPRFFWRLLLRSNDREVAELLADATSFGRAFPIIAVNVFDDAMATQAEAILAQGGGKAVTEELRQFVLAELRVR